MKSGTVGVDPFETVKHCYQSLIVETVMIEQNSNSTLIMFSKEGTFMWGKQSSNQSLQMTFDMKDAQERFLRQQKGSIPIIFAEYIIISEARLLFHPPLYCRFRFD